MVKDSSEDPPKYCLGNDYKKDKKSKWCSGYKIYLTQALLQIEKLYGALPKKEIPMIDGDHPEEDESEIMDDDGHQK